MKFVRPSTLLVTAISAIVVEVEGMAGIGSRPTGFQAVTLAIAIVASSWLVWTGRSGADLGLKKNSVP